MKVGKIAQRSKLFLAENLLFSMLKSNISVQKKRRRSKRKKRENIRKESEKRTS
jgi:hypothetical protein